MRPLILASAVILAASAGAAVPPVPVQVGSTAPSQQVSDMPVLNPNAPVGKACPPTSRTEAARRGGRLEARHLNELPPADMYMAVDREVNGCQAPIIAGYGFGGGRR